MRKNSDNDILIRLALVEDIGAGDITTEAIKLGNIRGLANVYAKGNGVISGIEQFKRVFELLSRKPVFKIYKRDGSKIKKGEKVISVSAPMAALLKGERTAMNFLCHLSGVATAANQFTSAIKGNKARVLDTRKTMPGMRMLEKRAVRHGGGRNHRTGLFDMYLIKENHIAAAGGLKQAMEMAKAHRKTKRINIEIEVTNIAELQEVLIYRPDYILLDNFEISGLKKAVGIARKADKRVLLEASGNININNIKSVAETGVDRISIGRITHSAPALDLSFQIANWKK